MKRLILIILTVIYMLAPVNAVALSMDECEIGKSVSFKDGFFDKPGKIIQKDLHDNSVKIKLISGDTIWVKPSELKFHSLGLNDLVEESVAKFVFELLKDYEKKFIYIDTRDSDQHKEEKSISFNYAKKLGKFIEKDGVVFLVEKNDTLQSRKLLNKILPNHTYSYNDAPFIVGYLSGNNIKNSDMVVSLAGMGDKCLSNFFQDLEQAIVRDKIDKQTMLRWSRNSIICETTRYTKEKYSLDLEKIWQYVRGMINLNL